MSESFELIVDEHNKLVLKRPGQDDVRDVRIRRSFPWSNPAQYISVRSSEGKELMLIESLSGLPESLRPTFARYTGQESQEERERISRDKPDILLTNFMMAELLMTRQNSRR